MEEKERVSIPDFFIQSNMQNGKWISELPDIIEQICLTTGFKVSSAEEKSRFGLVLYGKYNDSDAVLKILPKGEKGRNEVKYLMMSKCPYLNRPIISDIDGGYYIAPKGHLKSGISDTIAWKLFGDVYTCVDTYCEDIKDYCDKIEEQLQGIKNLNNDTLLEMLLYAKWLYYKYFFHDSMYMLHGDLRIDNLIFINEEIRIIDPIGINAPLEFLPLRYIEDVIFKLDHDEFDETLRRQLKSSSSIGMDERKVGIALLIDSTVRTVSSALRAENEAIIHRGVDNYAWIKELLHI